MIDRGTKSLLESAPFLVLVFVVSMSDCNYAFEGLPIRFTIAAKPAKGGKEVGRGRTLFLAIPWVKFMPPPRHLLNSFPFSVASGF